MTSGRKPKVLLRRTYDRLRGRYMFKIGAAVLLVTAVLLAGSAFTFTQTQANVSSDAENTLVTAAEREAQGIDGWIQERDEDAITISSRPILLVGETYDIRDYLQESQELLPNHVIDIHLYNMDTNTIEISTSREHDQREVTTADRPWGVDLDAFSSSEEVRSFEPYEADGEQRLAFMSRVAGQGTYAVVLVTDLSVRGALLEPPVEGSVMEVMSTDSGGVVIAANSDAILQEYFALEALPHLNDELTTARVDTVTNEHELIDDSQMVVAQVPIEQKPWAVTIAAPQDTIYATTGAVTQNILLLVAISIFGLVGLGAVISRDINNSLDDMTSYAEEIEQGNLEVQIDRSRADEFGQLAQLFVRIRDTLQAQLTEVENKATQADAAKAEAEQFASHLESKAREYEAVMDACRDGDLSARLDAHSESEALEQIAVSFNEMLESLEATVVDVRHFAEDVQATNERLVSDIADVNESSIEVATSIDEIAHGAEEQQSNLDQVATEMNNLSATIEEIASSSESVAGKSERAVDAVESSKNDAKAAIDEIQAIKTQADQTIEEIDALDEQVRDIAEITDFISNMADQTNILALNASIEAARAGDAGSGFAVVADEVKSLAGETQEAAEDIEAIVDNLQTQTNRTVADFETVHSRVERGIEVIENANESLATVESHVSETNSTIQDINQSTERQAVSTEEVASAVDDVVSISEESTSEAQSVASAAEQQQQIIAAVGDRTDSLTQNVEQLGDQLAQFTTDETQQNTSDTETATQPPEQLADGGITDNGEPESKDEHTT